MFKDLYLVWLGGTSGAAFLLYGLDRVQSRRNGWRVPEVALHMLALSGGFPGGWAGRAVFRHKTRKGFFTFVLAASTMLHAWLAYLLFFR